MLLKYKPYINNKNEKKKQEYRYYQSEKKFEKKELNYMLKKAEKNKKEKSKNKGSSKKKESHSGKKNKINKSLLGDMNKNKAGWKYLKNGMKTKKNYQKIIIIKVWKI